MALDVACAGPLKVLYRLCGNLEAWLEQLLLWQPGLRALNVLLFPLNPLRMLGDHVVSILAKVIHAEAHPVECTGTALVNFAEALRRVLPLRVCLRLLELLAFLH